jgi:hypothetical protein
MAKTSWPTSADVLAYLDTLGVSQIPQGINLDDEVAAAVLALEAYADISPFLAGEPASYDFNAPRTSRLDLGSPFATITSVCVGKSATSDGSALADQVDYWPKPFGGPYTSIEFRDIQYGEPESVCVTGRRGYSITVPLDAWNAVRDMAAAGVYRLASMGGTVALGPASRVKQGGVDIEFSGSRSAMSTDERLRAAAEEVFKRYRRPTAVGLNP